MFEQIGQLSATACFQMRKTDTGLKSFNMYGVQRNNLFLKNYTSTSEGAVS